MSRARLAMLFPGQGSQYPQMARDVLRCATGRSLLGQAEDVSGLPLTDLMSTADAATLAHPAVAQLSVLVHSLALVDQLAAQGVRPDVVAGHSLGEYTAMAAAGMLDRPTALSLVARRGQAMAEAARSRPGAMGAVVGLDAQRVQQMCDAVDGLVVLANINSPRQVVVSGSPEPVEAVLSAARGAGALRAKTLRVGGAYHSPLMAPAAATMTAAWADVVLAPPRCTFVSSTSGALVTDPAAQASAMRRQVGAPVRWATTMAAVTAAGVAAVVEVGPGRVLAGLAREQAPGLPQLLLRPGVPVAWPPAGHDGERVSGGTLAAAVAR
ncbi:ACP S-malonyltransferase [Microlunatus lacustris]